MMFLVNTISAEVEPVPGKKGWYQLTGRGMRRWTDEVSELVDPKRADLNAKILGIHDYDPEIALRDPRFNSENEHDFKNGGGSFGVVKNADGTHTMYLLVNRAEHALFRFLCPHEAGEYGDTICEPIEDYRVEKRAPTKKKAKALA